MPNLLKVKRPFALKTKNVELNSVKNLATDFKNLEKEFLDISVKLTKIKRQIKKAESIKDEEQRKKKLEELISSCNNATNSIVNYKPVSSLFASDFVELIHFYDLE